MYLTGFMYPLVTHWAWDSTGWLYKGIDIDYNGEQVNIAYQVRNDVMYGIIHFTHNAPQMRGG